MFHNVLKDTDEKMMTSSVEEALLIELNYAKDRILQLEKTTRWWSESTAIWREKWGRMRNERDDLRKKLDIIFAQKNALIKEYEQLQNKNNELNKYIENLNNKKIARVEPLNNQTSNHDNAISIPECNASIPENSASTNDPLGESNENGNISLPQCNTSKSADVSIAESNVDILNSEDCFRNESNIFSMESFRFSFNSSNSSENLLDVNENLKYLENMFQELLSDKQTNSIDTGRASRALTHVKKIQRNIFFMKNYFSFGNNNRIFSNESSLESCSSKIDSSTSIQVSSIPSNIESTFENKRKIADLRKEIEQLLDNNYKEWEKRERAENKVAEFERTLKAKDQIIKELEEQVKKRTAEVQDARKYAMNIANDEIEHNSEELKLLKISLTKTKKTLNDKTDELQHQKKRTEQLELEIKKLKDRIEEIKNQSYNFQEKADLQESHIRKLQRTVEEERHQKEGYEMQLKHVTNRLKKQTNSIQRGNET